MSQKAVKIPRAPAGCRGEIIARANAVCPYFTMFPLSVPLRQLTGISEHSTVLDPFCGRGTTNFAARMLGLPSIGIDSNPVAVAITQSKLVAVTPQQIASACRRILATEPAGEIPDGRFWELAYDRATLADLSRLRSALNRNCDSPARKALRGVVLGALHGPRNVGRPSYFSNQMPRTFASKPDYSIRFWESKQLTPAHVDVMDLVGRKAKHYYSHLPPDGEHTIFQADSRTFAVPIKRRAVTHVLTSPPYYGMRTYIPDQWLRSWFLGGPPAAEYRQPMQLSHGSPAEFAEQLALVWRNTASVAKPGARYSIRFGGIHDRRVSPRTLLLDSLNLSGRKFRVLTIRSAGGSSRGKRQAEQFNRVLKAPIEEIDLFARLED